MNAFHRWYCNSERWRTTLQETYLPATVRGLDLGDEVLEIGPGPGVGTDWLQAHVPRLTSIEIDSKLAAALRRRMDGTNVTVVEGDATAMPFENGRFSAVVSLTMLHHVPSRLHDRLLAEAHRVLRPGGVFAGMDSTPNLVWNLYHLFDDRNPVEPSTFGARLAAAGFRDVKVRASKSGFGWRATA